MKEDLADGLREMGWARVQEEFPLVACRLIDSVASEELETYRTPAQAQKQLRSMEALVKKLRSVCMGLNGLSEPDRKTINHWSASSSELDNGTVPDRIASLIHAADQIGPGLATLMELLEFRTAQGTGTRPRNESAYTIAEALLDAYMVGKGSLPTYGRQPDERTVSGEYCRLLEMLFDWKCLKIRDVVHVAETLIKPLKDNPKLERARLDSIYKEQSALVQRYLSGRLSIFDVSHIEKAKQGL